MSIEYSYIPVPPVTEITISPSAKLQFVGSDEATFVILGAFGAFKTTGFPASGVSHVPSLFLTTTLYVPADKPVNEFDTCQFAPLSILYSKIPLPVAVTVTVPLSVPQFVGSVDATFVIVGDTGTPII